MTLTYRLYYSANTIIHKNVLIIHKNVFIIHTSATKVHVFEKEMSQFYSIKKTGDKY